MTQEKGIPYQRHRPSAALRAFLEPLDPGPYFDCGRARLHGLDDALVREAKSRGREPGDDAFELVATEAGLVFCRESISFAIAAPWDRITVGRPRGEDPVELAVIWPVHGELVFTVSRRLAGNVLRRWVQRRARDASRPGSASAPVRPWSPEAAPKVKSPAAPAALRASDGVAIGSTEGRRRAARTAATTRPPAPAARGERTRRTDASSGVSRRPGDAEPVNTQRIDRQPVDRLPVDTVLARLANPGSASDPSGRPKSVQSAEPVPQVELAEPPTAETVGASATRRDSDRREDAPEPPPIRPASATRRPGRAAIAGPTASGAVSGPLRPARIDQRFIVDRQPERPRSRVGGPASLLAAMLAASVTVFLVVISVSAYRSGRLGQADGTDEAASASASVETVEAVDGSDDATDRDDEASVDPTIAAPTTIDQRRIGDGVDRGGTVPRSLPLADDETVDDVDIEGLDGSGSGPTPGPTSDSDVATSPIPTGPVRCNSNYSGCVPDVDDVDCPGGEGPVFASEPGVVMGEDVYGLDTDGDGRTCEADQPV